jgi:hypothetical protein
VAASRNRATIQPDVQFQCATGGRSEWAVENKVRPGAAHFLLESGHINQ